MMNRLILIGLLSITGAAQAVEPASPPGLLPTEIARPLLEQDPAVAAAHAGLEVARQEAGILDKSPYEWTAKMASQRRSLRYPDNSSNYQEWNVAVERTLRLPGKAAADRSIGSATVKESQARYGEALHEAARGLMGLWVDWLAAEHARELAEINLRSLEESLVTVEKRVRAGDASQLELSIARAEQAEQKRQYNDATTQAAAARTRLSVRFPGSDRQVTTLPMPLPMEKDALFWRDRVLAQSDELKVVQAQLQMAQAHAERARADKTPDPTFGVYTAYEVGGRERISGITISIPIPGGVRDSRSAKASAAIAVSHQEVELKKRQLAANVESAVVTARGAYDSLEIAKEGATAMQENARLLQRAYALGEAELQALLLARRQATAAMNSALQAQVAALKAYYGLLVDAHLIWDMDHE